MIRINSNITIPDTDLNYEFTRSSGPGGQHVNTTDSAVQLRFDIDACEALPGGVKHRLKQLAGNKLTKEGILLLTAQDERSQGRNIEAVTQRFRELVRQACVKPKRRRATRPTRAARERRLNKKKSRGEVKRLRQPPKRPES